MAINLAAKYSNKIAEAYVKESIFKGHLNNQYEFAGVKSVKIYTPTTIALTDYNRSASSNRYGTPTEMQDTLQEMILRKDRSFSLTVDKGNNEDQMGIKPAAQMLALQLKERAVPEYDLYCATELALHAGKSIASGTAISKSNVVDRISDGTVWLDDAEVPGDNRTLYVTATVYKYLRLSDEFQKSEPLITKSLSKGEVGTFDGMTVIKVPKNRIPAGVNFIIVHRDAVTAPIKLSETKLHQDPPGINGNLIEGRQYYDCFIIGARANGVYVDVNSGTLSKVATPTQSSNVVSTTTSGAYIKYTLDGTDPRFSASAIVVTAATTTTAVGSAGDTVKAYAYKAGSVDSDLLTFTRT